MNHHHHQQLRSTTTTATTDSSSTASPAAALAAAGGGGGEEYEDLMPVMAGRLGAEGLLSELRAGFRLLADPARGAITADSLRRSAATVLGLAGGGAGGMMTAEEAAAMVREGDQDGDGVLSEAEFCVLMVRLSPGIMGDAEGWLEVAFADELLRSPPAAV
uniref:EF-hand domain-containing protein n=1 Tax=Leersia perrieri TaxID=77586 RepID=A0A0D9VBJ3_9ORYZ